MCLHRTTTSNWVWWPETWPGLRGPAVTTDQTEAAIPPTDQSEASGASAVTRLCFRVRSWDTTQHDTTLPIWHLIVSALLHSLLTWRHGHCHQGLLNTDIWWWWAVLPVSCCSQADQAEWPWQGWAHPCWPFLTFQPPAPAGEESTFVNTTQLLKLKEYKMDETHFICF